MTTKKIIVSIAAQTLTLYDHDAPVQQFSISTALNGVGELEGTGCTPLGKHRICEKFGADLPVGAVLVGRKFTGEIYSNALAAKHPDRDWILSRILWLDGMEAGKNSGIQCTPDGEACCDSKARYIYIHGTPDSEPMGEPRSHGCVRMRNSDVMALFELVDVDTPVHIAP